jgi:glycosyltransferase involved in cell wall biosynthesis
MALYSAAHVPVSVVIPAYNEEARIREALASVRAQTVQPYEIVVVDDGSTDRTASIARAAGARVIEQPNRGLAAARNAGIRAAGAPWIAFLDADDHFFPHKLERTWAAHERSPEVSFVLCDFAVVEGGRTVSPSALAATWQFRRMARRPLGDGVSFAAREALCRALVVGNFLSSSTVLFERDIAFRHELFYDDNLPSNAECHVAEDIEWYLRVLRYSDALIVEVPLADYVRRPGSLAARNGRVRSGDVRLGELVAAAPERYAGSAAQGFIRARPMHLRRAALDWLRENDLARARLGFARSFRARPGIDTAALFAASALADNRIGRRWLSALRTVWLRRPRRRHEIVPQAR